MKTTKEYIKEIVEVTREWFGNRDRDEIVEIIKDKVCHGDQVLYRQLNEFIDAVLDGFGLEE